jgi:tetratricopeptide (TPR) repeat protein
LLHRELQLQLPPLPSQETVEKRPIYGGFYARGDIMVMTDDCTTAAQALNLLGSIYMEENNFLAAEAEFKRATNVDPRFAKSYYNLALLYQGELQDTNRAKAYLQRFKQVNTSAKNLTNRARTGSFDSQRVLLRQGSVSVQPDVFTDAPPTPPTSRNASRQKKTSPLDHK